MNDAPGQKAETKLAAEEFLEALSVQGIDYFFANPGTDFAPIVEGYARAQQSNRKLPKPMVIPHENAAVGMAHGYYMMTGKPQCVMLHTNVGTANSINMLINASRDRTPVLLASGRTPITEEGPIGTRNAYIHWAQEMFDQAGMLREVVKWDYEMRRGDQSYQVVERAMELAMSSPRGPVYLSLPRETLGEEVPATSEARPARAVASVPRASASDIARIADWIAEAKRPLIITAAAGKDPEAATLLADIATRYALPVVTFNPRYFNIAGTHPMFQGSMPGQLLAEADLVLVLECDVPWMPSREAPRAGARIVQVGEDPLYGRYPMRSFRSDLTVCAGVAPVLADLDAALATRLAGNAEIVARREMLTARSAKLRAGWQAEIDKTRGGQDITLPMFNEGLRCLIDDDTVIVNEYSFRQEYCPLEQPGSMFGLSSAGGLGWGLPAALGAKLACPEKLVVAVLGDGAYMFANPTACHWTAAAHKLPVLTVLFNNAIYNAVRRATLDVYGTGVAAQDDGQLLADLKPSPDFEHMMKVHGGHAERVERPEELVPALLRAAAAVRGGQQALVNVLTVV